MIDSAMPTPPVVDSPPVDTPPVPVPSPGIPAASSDYPLDRVVVVLVVETIWHPVAVLS